MKDHKVTIKPLETIETTGISQVPNHEKCVSVIIEPSPVNWQGNEIYKIPGYNFLKVGSKQVELALGNVSSRTVTLKRGTVVAHVSAVNEIPPKLAPKIIAKASTVNVHPGVCPSAEVEIERKSVNPDAQQVHTLPTPGRLDKLFEKLDLSGAQAWTDQEKQEIRDLLTEYHDLFALDDLELGKTSLVEHSIKLTNDTPFKERYQRIPPHQYKEVKKHLKEMMEIGAIQKSANPLASAVVLVRKKDGSFRLCINLRKLKARTRKYDTVLHALRNL